MERTVTITEELLLAGSTNGIGWNARQVKALGIGWPLVKGWKERAIGREVSQESVDRFLALKGAAKARKPNRREKQAAHNEAWKSARDEREKRSNREIAADIIRSRRNGVYDKSTFKRVDLVVPCSEHEKAKALGARWDAIRKVWYANSVAVLSRCERWHRRENKAEIPQCLTELDREARDHMSSIASDPPW